MGRPSNRTKKPKKAAVRRRSAAEPARPRLRPLRDRVVVRRAEKAEEHVGGILVPDSAREKPQEADVVAVGPGRLTDEGVAVEMALRPGDRILVGKWSGTEVTVDDQEYLILKEDEVLCLLDEE